MKLGNRIHKLRIDSNVSQEQFAEIFNVSQQSVAKWENGSSQPDLEKLIKISKYFDISLDALILDNDTRIIEEMNRNKKLKPQYENLHDWEFYASNLLVEYQQSIDEGLDFEKYKNLFFAVSMLPKDEIKKQLGDILFEIVMNAKQKEGYKYIEPSQLDEIKELRSVYSIKPNNSIDIKEKIYGAWMGRVCGCLLGKPLEGITTDELMPFLKETDNYPLQRYVYHSDITDDIIDKYKYSFANRAYIDDRKGMPPDDDTNYTVLAQIIIEKYGKEFTPYDISREWLEMQPKNAYCTAERVAFCNFIKGYEPPKSAVYKNPYREWIGAQIRGDYFGYINPGNPEVAAEMAWRDASISHVKNGIYGEMFVAAMLATAAINNNIEDIILGGLSQIPHTSRLHEAVMTVLDDFKNGAKKEDVFADIHKRFDQNDRHDWCHTISNAMIVVASLLFGRGDYAKSICMAVERCFDTDCNGATVGSILGMANGINSIPEYWKAPIDDTLYTTLFGIEKVKISERADLTMKHINS